MGKGFPKAPFLRRAVPKYPLRDPMAKTYYAGMETLALCRRCGTETGHRVLYVTDGVPEKLICAACGSAHKFRAERAAGPAPPKVPNAPKGRSPASASQFQALMVEERAGAAAKPYGQGVRWEEGMWLDHPSFGLGKVQRRSGQKINVLFRSGVKTLVAL
jgi:hypothetical protein